MKQLTVILATAILGIGMTGCVGMRYPDSNTGGKEDFEAFKEFLAEAQADWECDKYDGTVRRHADKNKVENVRGPRPEDVDNVPMALVNGKKRAQEFLDYLKKRQDQLGQTEYPPELVHERDALLAQSRPFSEALTSYIKQDVRAETDKVLNDIRSNADDHIADSKRMWSPVAISLAPSAQWPRADADVTCLCLNVFNGKYRNVYCMDIAIGKNIVSSCMAGIQLAGFANSSDTVYGLQLAAFNNDALELVGGAQVSLANVSSCYGSWLQVGGLFNDSGFFTGAQIAGLNNTAYSCKGLQIGIDNDAQELSGVQIGVFNDANKLSGVQIGVFNDAQELSGIQIGVFNDAQELSGVQIGAFNNAGKAKGFGLGVLNRIGDANCYCLPIVNLNF